MKIKLLEVREASGEFLNSPKDVFDLMRDEARADRECFWVLHLNTKNRVIEKELISMGVVNASMIMPREVFRKAVINGTVSILSVHNHPSGDLKPSSEDRRTWDMLRKAGEILNIPVIDNLIVSTQGVFSEEANRNPSHPLRP